MVTGSTDTKLSHAGHYTGVQGQTITRHAVTWVLFSMLCIVVTGVDLDTVLYNSTGRFSSGG